MKDNIAPVYSKWSKVSVVDLRALAGKTYRTGLDEAAQRPGESRNDPVYVTVPGRYGELYPHDEKRIAALITSARVANRVKLEKVRIADLYAEGDTESVFLFEQEHFSEVIRYIKPYRKRRLTPEQRNAASERLKAYRFQRT